MTNKPPDQFEFSRSLDLITGSWIAMEHAAKRVARSVSRAIETEGLLRR